jgi:FkbM family methyltransferase
MQGKYFTDYFFIFLDMKFHQFFQLLGLEIRQIVSSEHLFLFNKCIKWRRREQHIIQFNSHKFIVPDGPSFAWQLKEIFSDESYRFHSLKECPVILDIGANIGTSVIWFKMNYPTSKILAFEADKDIYEILAQNTSYLTDVTLYNKAVWISDDILSFQADGADGGSLIADGTNIKTIQGIRLKRFLEDCEERIDFLKMDIEGAEVAVIKDCNEILSKIDNIFIEYHSFSKEKQSLGDILCVLSDNGFRYYIKEVCKTKRNPFINSFRNQMMDMQIEIYGYRY